MNDKLITVFRERLVSGLRRKSITTASKWAEAYRVMGMPLPGPWAFKRHPWLREMHDCEDDWVGQKAAQMGFTETCLNVTLFTIDVKAESILYVLPASTPDASEFSASRFDPALEMSDHLKNLFSKVKNIGHKRAGSANLYIRGSRSRSQMKSVPVSKIVFDELDEMVQKNVTLALERTSGQVSSQIIKISTPTIGNFGISSEYNNSTAEHYFFRCPNCGHMTELVFPDCLVMTSDVISDPKILESYIICKECLGKLPHEDKVTFLQDGEWVPSFENRMVRGFHVNQLYSTTEAPSKIAISYLRGLTNPEDETEFYNSKLGIPHEVEGARITDGFLDQCVGEYISGPKKHGIVTMGIDVGKFLHYEIASWSLSESEKSNSLIDAVPQVIAAGKVENFEDLDAILKEYRVLFAVIDANPERRKALEFAQRFYGLVKLCFYGMGVSGKELHMHAEEDCTITVDRTSWMDAALSRFKNQLISLPKDISIEYRSHLKIPTRTYEKDKRGNPVGRFLTPANAADHFAHARTYSEIALAIVVSQDVAKDINNVY